jgi:glucose/arabinose dehydrogenase
MKFRLTAISVSLTLCAAAEIQLPPGFVAETLVEGINAATAVTAASDGRIFYTEQTGAVRIVRDGKLLATPALDLAPHLDTYWERGLIGITLHPEFPGIPHLFLVYVAKEPHTHHVVSRFTISGDRIDPESEMVLLRGDDQAKIAGNVPGGHQGGTIIFGPDGMLYIGIGEHTNDNASQSLDTLQGKILRLKPDGSIPEDNGFYRKTHGKYRSIHAIGIRNPFGLAVEPATGRIFECDVGASAFEEINIITSGGNYGWPEAEGFSKKAGLINPIHAYPPTVGRSICGAAFYPAGGPFPPSWHGKLLFTDWASNWLHAIDSSEPEKLIPFAEGLAAPVALTISPDGALWVLNRNTFWRDPAKFRPNSGSLVRIRHLGDAAPPVAQAKSPGRLSETGVFSDLKNLSPADGSHPFQLNAPAWTPGLKTSRWIRVPEKSVIQVNTGSSWSFPKGTTIVEHFSNDHGPHETQVYIANGNGTYQAAAYPWRSDTTDPERATTASVVPIAGTNDLRWLSPGTVAALDPEMPAAGFAPQWNTAQLNVAGQLDAWKKRGWLPGDLDIPRLPKLSPLEDLTAAPEHRVRSYLDANCAGCHHPGGLSRALFDARFTTPLEESGMLGGSLVVPIPGIADSRVIAPGHPEKSSLFFRMRCHDAMRMPPIAVNDIESPVIPLIESWIKGLPADVPAIPSRVVLAEANDNGQACYRIQTPQATWFLEKSGAGLSSLVDAEGNDWLGFDPTPGTGAGGEYRGFPNAVFQQGGSFFHARNQGTDPSVTTVDHVSPELVTISARSSNGEWACRYDFHPDHCRFTMTRVPAERSYWVLYEGVPGGTPDEDDWWISSANTTRRSVLETQLDDLPSPEWIAFGDPRKRRSLALLHHADDAHPDRYYLMEQKMTVFGFGRDGMKRLLTDAPRSFSIGLIEDDRATAIIRSVESWLKTPSH